MPAPKVQEWTVNVRPVSDMGGFLDMMRYDRCRVETWTIADASTGSRYLITLAFDKEPTFGRWDSFGLHLREVGR